jgi:hypothetical protein
MRAQLEFVAADLSSEPFFTRIAGRDGAEATFALFGQYSPTILPRIGNRVRKRLPTGNLPCANVSINPGHLQGSSSAVIGSSRPQSTSSTISMPRTVSRAGMAGSRTGISSLRRLNRDIQEDRPRPHASGLLATSRAGDGLCSGRHLSGRSHPARREGKIGRLLHPDRDSRYDAGRAALSDTVFLKAPTEWLIYNEFQG